MANPSHELREILDSKGELILYDIYVDGRWIGSRRTREYCMSAIKQHIESFYKPTKPKKKGK